MTHNFWPCVRCGGPVPRWPLATICDACAAAGDDLEAEAVRRELVAVRDLDDGRELTIQTIGAAQGRLTVGPRPSHGRYVDAWDYPSHQLAREAMASWDGHGDPPDGWTRNLTTGRRRPDGDPTKQYVRR